jgi:hypothetical protein
MKIRTALQGQVSYPLMGRYVKFIRDCRGVFCRVAQRNPGQGLVRQQFFCYVCSMGNRFFSSMRFHHATDGMWIVAHRMPVPFLPVHSSFSCIRIIQGR